MSKTREEMIEALTLEAINYIREAMLHGDTGLLGDYLELGFIGYSHMDEETIGEEDKT